jgi:uncharacterized membrane protein
MMSAAHVHLVLNHVPALGVVFAGVLLAIGLLRRQSGLQRLAFAFLAAFAVLAIPVYLTGESAEHLAERLPGVNEAAIDRHEGAAKATIVAVEILGGLALVGLVVARRVSAVARTFAAGMLAATLATAGLFGWTGYLGGEIRHPEIRAAARAAGGPPAATTRRHGDDD